MSSVCDELELAPGPTDWGRLLVPFPFFTSFPFYLQVIFQATFSFPVLVFGLLSWGLSIL